MSSRLRLLSLLVVAAGCGRTTMGPCVLGEEDCPCTANGACHRGLACVAGVCESAAAPGSGGSPGSGGLVGPGGATGRGGTVGSGGVTLGLGGNGKGGSPGYGGTLGAVTFNHGQAVGGAMSGYGWVALGPKDSLLSPTCGGFPITSATPCSSTTDWSGTGLCVTGTIPALPVSPSTTDYNDNWGIMVSANASSVGGGTLGQSYATVTVNVTGTPSTGLRALVHRKWDQDAVNYCANMVSGARIAFASFNSQCWDGRGTPLTAADVPNIDWVGVQVPSTLAPINVSNLCLVSLVFE